MSENEDAAEQTVESQQSAASPASEFDGAAERFLELESQLDAGPDATGVGLIVDAERVDAASVPADYPLSGDPTEALALTVEAGDRRVQTYLAWPGGEATVAEWRREDEADAALSRLLAAMDVELGDLYGRRVPVERVDGHLRVVVPSETPRSSGDWGVGVVLGQVLNAGLLGLVGLAAAGGGGVAPLLVAWLLVSVVWLPYATWKDAWYLRTHSDADEGPAFWATLSALPGPNLLAGLAYLRRRGRARFLGEEPSLWTRLRRRLRPS